MSFKMVTVTFSKNSVTVSFSTVPLPFINTLVGVDHASLALRHAIDPVAVVTVAILVEEGATSVFFVFEPVARILSSKFFILQSPESALTMTFVKGPHAFILITGFVELNAETFFLVVAPIT